SNVPVATDSKRSRGRLRSHFLRWLTRSPGSNRPYANSVQRRNLIEFQPFLKQHGCISASTQVTEKAQDDCRRWAESIVFHRRWRKLIIGNTSQVKMGPVVGAEAAFPSRFSIYGGTRANPRVWEGGSVPRRREMLHADNRESRN